MKNLNLQVAETQETTAVQAQAIQQNQNNGGMKIMRKLKKICAKAMAKLNGVAIRTQGVLANESGDQFTGFLIIVLLVVVVGAAFLILYQGSIMDIWNGIVGKIKSTFGI